MAGPFGGRPFFGMRTEEEKREYYKHSFRGGIPRAGGETIRVRDGGEEATLVMTEPSSSYPAHIYKVEVNAGEYSRLQRWALWHEYSDSAKEAYRTYVREKVVKYFTHFEKKWDEDKLDAVIEESLNWEISHGYDITSPQWDDRDKPGCASLAAREVIGRKEEFLVGRKRRERRPVRDRSEWNE